MAKLVVLTPALSGKTFEITAEKTTVGRLEDNQVCISDSSVSSHHAELSLKGDDILVKDLNSTNGTYINGEQIKEATLKPGQTLRFGGIDLRYETGKRQLDQPRAGGVNIGDTPGASSPSGNTAFSKKSNKANKIFLVVVAVLVIAIIAGLIIAFSGVSGKSG